MRNLARSLSAAFALSCCAASASAAVLIDASQRSLETRTDLVLVFDDALEPSAAADIANYIVTGRTIVGVSLNPSAPNLVYLKLHVATPLQPGSQYYVTTRGPLASATVSFAARSLATEIANIKASQLPSGAISQNAPYGPPWNTGEPVRVVPYFACDAARGLLFAERITRDRTLLPPVWNYLQWHAAQLREDGTITDFVGTYPSYPSTNDYDSSDSYGALFLSTLWMWYQESGDLSQLATMSTAIHRSVAAMELTLEPDNLTWAKPTYRFKYTMDNCEVVDGFRAASQLAHALGQESDSAAWAAQSEAVAAAIKLSLYDRAQQHYALALDEAGGLANDWSLYEFDGMANNFAIYYLHQPTEARAADAWAASKARFAPAHVPVAKVNWSMPLTAIHMLDMTTRDATYPAAFTRSLGVPDRNAHESARFIEIEFRERADADSWLIF